MKPLINHIIGGETRKTRAVSLRLSHGPAQNTSRPTRPEPTLKKPLSLLWQCIFQKYKRRFKKCLRHMNRSKLSTARKITGGVTSTEKDFIRWGGEIISMTKLEFDRPEAPG
jgi:hypothetical protein